MTKKKILIVDDEIELAQAIKIRLKAANYEILIAYNGIDGLEKAKNEKPDLILLDITMPDMDGYQTLQELKKDTQTKSIPVIMLTANSQLPDVTKATELGATDYVVKPFDYMQMLNRIKKVLG